MTDEPRINELEVKVAFLEESLNTLSDEYYKQQQLLQKMKDQFAALQKKLDNFQQSSASDYPNYIDDKPPHY